MADALFHTQASGDPLNHKHAETRIIDAEILLHQTFNTNPQEGCALLFKLYYARLVSHAIRFVYSKQIAEDLVADTFCRFWDDRIFEKIQCSYHAYLFKSVRHRAYNYVKFELARRSQRAYEYYNVASTSPCEILQYVELYQLLEKTINSLPQQCKRAFLLSRVDSKSYHEIAVELNISVKAIEAHISKALRILRSEVNKEYNWK